MIKTALFSNFTDREFIGWWNGKSRKYAPGQSEYMTVELARHFAGHLVNQELMTRDLNGSLKYKDGEKMLSPKEPTQFPIYIALFNKAFHPDETEAVGDSTDDIEAIIETTQRNRAEKSKLKESAEGPQDPSQPNNEISNLLPDEDEEFAGAPDESKV